MATLQSNDLLLIERGGSSYKIEYRDLQQVVSVKDFGATGNGSTDDTAAVNAALAASGAIYFPPGTYKVAGKLSTTNRSVHIYGDGSQLSYIDFTSGGIDFKGVQVGGSHTCIIENIGIIGSGDAAVKIEYTTNGSVTQKAYCHDVAIAGSFTVGFDLINTDLSLFDTCSVSDAPFGVKLTETSAGSDPVDIKFNNMKLASCDIGFKIQAKAEGIYITNSLVFAGRMGIDIDATSGLPGGEGAEPYYIISGCNFDTYQYGIYARGIMQSVISDNCFYKYKGTDTLSDNWSGLVLANNSFDNTITDNVFNSTIVPHVGATATLVGINVLRSTHTSFSNNTFLSLDFGMSLGGDSRTTFLKFVNNNYREVTKYFNYANTAAKVAEFTSHGHIQLGANEANGYEMINTNGFTVYDGISPGGFRISNDSLTLGGLYESQFLRSDADDTAIGTLTIDGSIRFNDGKPAYFGTHSDAAQFHNGSHFYTDLGTGNYYIRAGTNIKYTFDRSGKFTSEDRIVAGTHSNANVAFQFKGRPNSGLGFPAAEDVALFANGTKVLAGKSNGSLYFGSAPDDAMLPGNNNTKNGLLLESDGRFIQKRNSTNNSGYAFLAGGNTGFFEVRNDGDCNNTNGRYEQASDARLKENVVECKSQWEDIKALRWVNYNYRPETNMPQHTQLGVVAQEAEAVCPGLISESEVPAERFAPELKAEFGDTYKSVAYSLIAMKSAAALKEALIRIEELERRLDELSK